MRLGKGATDVRVGGRHGEAEVRQGPFEKGNPEVDAVTSRSGRVRARNASWWPRPLPTEKRSDARSLPERLDEMDEPRGRTQTAVRPEEDAPRLFFRQTQPAARGRAAGRPEAESGESGTEEALDRLHRSGARDGLVDEPQREPLAGEADVEAGAVEVGGEDEGALGGVEKRARSGRAEAREVGETLAVDDAGSGWVARGRRRVAEKDREEAEARGRVVPVPLGEDGRECESPRDGAGEEEPRNGFEDPVPDLALFGEVQIGGFLGVGREKGRARVGLLGGEAAGAKSRGRGDPGMRRNGVEGDAREDRRGKKSRAGRRQKEPCAGRRLFENLEEGAVGGRLGSGRRRAGRWPSSATRTEGGSRRPRERGRERSESSSP